MSKIRVRKRGNIWQYSFEVAKVSGERKSIYKSGFNSKPEAEKAGALAYAEYERAGLSFEPSDMSVSDYMDYWFKHYVEPNCRYNTRYNYDKVIRTHVKPTLGHYRLRALSPVIVQSWINDMVLKKNFSQNTVMNYAKVLSGALKYAVYPAQFIKSNPTLGTQVPKSARKAPTTEERVITLAQWQRIIERFPFSSPYHIPLMIGYYTGCRIGEVFALTWDDIDLDAATISITKITHRVVRCGVATRIGPTKTASSVRKIRIGDTLVKVLKDHQKRQRENEIKYGEHYRYTYAVQALDDLGRAVSNVISLPKSQPAEGVRLKMVCTQDNGEFVKQGSFTEVTRTISAGMGIPFNFHTLRHTHATFLISNGATVKDVQRRLGHNSVETTLDKYTADTEEMQSQTVEIFEDISSRAISPATVVERDLRELGQKLKAARLSAGLTQAAAAAELGVTKMVISLTENGHTPPKPQLVAAMELLYRVPGLVKVVC